MKHRHDSLNWCGARVKCGREFSRPVAKSFKEISATWTVPHLSKGSRGTGPWYATSLIGLDGGSVDSENKYQRTGSLQAGVIGTVDSARAQPTYQAFYGWLPDKITRIDPQILSVKAGDTVYVKITVEPAAARALVLFKNKTTGKKLPEKVVPEPARARFIGETVQWVIERNLPDDPDSKGPGELAKFEEKIVFRNAVGLTNDDERILPKHGDILWMEDTPKNRGDRDERYDPGDAPNHISKANLVKGHPDKIEIQYV